METYILDDYASYHLFRDSITLYTLHYIRQIESSITQSEELAEEYDAMKLDLITMKEDLEERKKENESLIERLNE